jgi:hypothetical protein
MNVEKFLKQKMAEGWNIQIECKSSRREYALTYEMYATRHVTDGSIFGEIVHGVGDTLEEALNSTFSKQKEQG